MKKATFQKPDATYHHGSLREQPEISHYKYEWHEGIRRPIKKECRTIPCSENNWKDGQQLEEGRDYKLESRANGFFVKGSYDNKCVYCGKIFHNTDKLWFCCQDCANELLAVPIVAQETEYDIWCDVIEIVLENDYESKAWLVKTLSQKFENLQRRKQ